jgi:D-sedoheptulose 7-phosphate isomerase
MMTWALTGPGPNPLADAADEALTCSAPDTATVQELHLVVIHLLCGAVDRTVARLEREEREAGDAAQGASGEAARARFLQGALR